MTEGQPPIEALVEAVVEGLVARRWTIALAESCTAGLLCAALCTPAGASRYLLGGIVAYANTLKTGLLGVPAALLAEHGAVSAEVALAMARGVRTATGSDLGVGMTGLAGPQAGRRSAKPVGTVYIALAGGPGGEQWREHSWNGDRQANMHASVRAALHFLGEELGTVEQSGRP